MVSATRDSHHPEELGLRDMARHSPFTHYFAVAARRRLEPGSATDIHLGASVDVGENHKASLQPADDLSDGRNADVGGCGSFMAHPETLLPMPDIDDPVQRFVSVVKFYLSGWHIRPAWVFQLLRDRCAN